MTYTPSGAKLMIDDISDWSQHNNARILNLMIGRCCTVHVSRFLSLTLIIVLKIHAYDVFAWMPGMGKSTLRDCNYLIKVETIVRIWYSILRVGEYLWTLLINEMCVMFSLNETWLISSVHYWWSWSIMLMRKHDMHNAW